MNFLEEIRAIYDSLSSVQKRIADYIFTYPEEVCFHSLKELSEVLGVTEVTILRFTKKIGLGSFVELKKKLKAYLHDRLSQEEPVTKAPFGSSDQGDSGNDSLMMYDRFVENEISVLKNTYTQIEVEKVLSAVSIIKEARNVYVIGHELGTAAASYLTRRLLTIGINVIDLGSVSRAIYNNYLAHTGPEDAVIIFSNPGYAKHLINTAKYLDKNRVPQIVITDKETAPVAAYATIVLPCNNRDLYFYNSVLGFFSVSSMLAYFTAMADIDETVKKRRRLSEAREAIGSISMIKERK